MNDTPQQKLSGLTPAIVNLLSLLVLFVGAAMTFVWILNNHNIVKFDPVVLRMFFNVALCFVFAGVAQMARKFNYPKISSLLGYFILVVALLTLFEYVTGLYTGIDQLFIQDASTHVINPGRMAPNTAFCFLLLSIVFITSRRTAFSHQHFLNGAIGVIVTSFGIIAFTGYFVGMPEFASWGNFTKMAAQTAFCFTLIGTALLLQAWQAQKTSSSGEMPQWSPMVITLAALIFTLNLFFILRAGEDTSIKNVAEINSGKLNLAIQSEFKQRVGALTRMAQRWEVNDGTPFTSWQADAQNYYKDFKGYQAIDWIDADYNVRWTMSSLAEERTQLLNFSDDPNRRPALDAARNQKQTVVTKIINLAQGKKGFLICIPINTKNGFDGFIVGVIDANEYLKAVLPAEITSLYNVKIAGNGEEIYSNSAYPVNEYLKTERNISIFNENWQIVASPYPETASLIRSSIPAFTLLFGIFISFLLGWIVYLLQKSRTEANNSQIANRRIQEEIAERNRAEQEISIRDGLYRTLVRNLPKTAVLLFDRDFKYTLADGPQLKEQNFSQEMLEGSTIYDVFPPEVCREWEPIYERALNGEHITFETKDNGKYFQMSVLPVKNETGEINAGMVKWRDVSEEKEIEKSLQTSEKRFKDLFDNAPMGYHEIDCDGRIVHVNQTELRMLGYSEAEMIGRMAWEFVVEAHSSEAVLAKLRGEAPLQPYERTFRRRDGSHLPVFIEEGLILDEHQKIVGIRTNFQDITDQKAIEQALRESESRYRDLVDKSLGLICSHALDGTLLSVNPAAAHSLGYEPEEMIGISLGEFLQPESKLPFSLYLKKVEREGSANGIIHLQTKSGAPLTWKFNNVVYQESDQEPYIVGHAQDISQLVEANKKIEQTSEALRLTNYQLAGILESTSDCIAAIDNDLNLIGYNKAYEQTFNALYKKPISIGMNLVQAYGDLPDNNRKSLTDWDRALKGETFMSVREFGEQESDRVIYEVYFNPIKDINGVQFGATQFVRDVTERKRAERALKESEERLQLFVEHAPAAIAMLDRDMNYVMASERWLKEYKLDAGEVIGRTCGEIFRDTPQKLEKIHQRGLQGEVLQCDEEPFPRQDGTTEWMKWEMRPWHDNQGDIGGIIFFTESITERKRIEEVLRQTAAFQEAILNSANYTVISTTIDGTIKAFNRTAQKWLGYSAGEVIGKTTPALFHDPAEVVKRAEELSKELGKTIEPGFEVFVNKSRRNLVDEREWTYTRKGGSTFPVMLSVTAIRDISGEITGFLCIGSDITVRKQMEAELEATRDAALESARLKSEFLANMSHEIRTPMNGIIGMSELLMETDLNSMQRDYTQTVQSSANSLLTIINDILDFSKIESGKLHFETVDFDLQYVLDSVIELFADTAEKKNLELASLIYADVPSSLRGDPGRLRQILINLIGNAVKFTDKGEIVVRVKVVANNENDCKLCFSVTDSGIGISPESQKYLFSAFTQADGSITRRFGGTGLGLAISRQLSVMMDGEIGVESEMGEGSTFWFTARLEKQPLESRQSNPRYDLSGLRVLIVDDNETNRKVLSIQTASWQMEADTAESGRLALEKMRTAATDGKHYDIVLVDLMMPEMNGFQLCEEIKRDDLIKETKLLLMPSYGTRGHAHQARKIGIDAYLIKPISQGDLFSCIANIFESPSNSKQAKAAKAPSKPTELVTRHTLEEKSRKQDEKFLILVAEDNPVNQKVISKQLETLGYKADIFSNGEEAVSAYPKRDYRLIFMDCQMPVMDGYTATSEIRKLESGTSRHVPIVALTASAIQGDREKCLEAGMDDYISKPTNREKLNELIENYKAAAPHVKEDKPAAVKIDKSADDSKGNFNLEIEKKNVSTRLRALIDECGEGLVTEFIDLFLEDVEKRLRSAMELIENEDFQNIRLEFHGLKGSTANMGAASISEMCNQMEKLAIENDLNNIQNTFTEIRQAFEHIKPHFFTERTLISIETLH